MIFTIAPTVASVKATELVTCAKILHLIGGISVLQQQGDEPAVEAAFERVAEQEARLLAAWAVRRQLEREAR